MKKFTHCIVALFLAFGCSFANADDYPSKVITMIVPFAAGGPTDTVARLISQSMGTALKQQVIVENVGLLGYVFSKLGCEPAPMLLGFILGPMMEEYLRRAMLLSHGDPLVFVKRPLSATMLVMAVLVMIVVLLSAIRTKREEAFQEEA